MAPGGIEVKQVEVNARVGGHFQVWHADAGFDMGGFECEIIELVPDQRIVFRWGFVGPERGAGPAYDSLLTITLEAARGNATTLTLVHERSDASLAAAMPHVADRVEVGWQLVLEKLAPMLASQQCVADAPERSHS